jgi:hypothetical protein
MKPNKKADTITSNSRVYDESLPFSVFLVRDESSLAKALKIRQSAYQRHVPELARQLGHAERYDGVPGVDIMLAISKLDGEPLGTMRIQTNRHEPLALEGSVVLPEWLQGRRLAEATRLGVSRDPVGRMVKTALFKAYYQYCLAAGVEWMVITARASLVRQYQALLFHDVFADERYVPMQHVGNVPHRILAINVPSVEPTWRERKHPLYDYFFRAQHADIEVTPEVEVPEIEKSAMYAF